MIGGFTAADIFENRLNVFGQVAKARKPVSDGKKQIAKLPDGDSSCDKFDNERDQKPAMLVGGIARRADQSRDFARRFEQPGLPSCVDSRCERARARAFGAGSQDVSRRLVDNVRLVHRYTAGHIRVARFLRIGPEPRPRLGSVATP